MPSVSAILIAREHRCLRTAILLWGVGCLLIGVQAYLKPHGHSVFRIYAHAGQAWWAGTDLYELPQGLPPELKDFYRYSPTFAVLTSPIAQLPPGAGNAAWKLLNAGIFALGLFVWCRRGLAPVPTTSHTAAIFVAAFFAVVSNIYNGQANLLMTGFLILGLTAVVRGYWWCAAGLLASATLIKAYPLALALVLSVMYWRTFPLRYLAALGAGLLIPFATQHPEYALRETGEWLRHITGSFDLNRERMRSLDRLFEIAGLGTDRLVHQALSACAGGVVLMVGMWSARRGRAPSVVLFRVGAWFSTWVLLFTPSSENATFCILGPFIAWAVVDSFRRPGAWTSRVWLVTSLYLMGLSGGDVGMLTKQFFTKYPATTLGGIMFQLWLIADLLRHRSAASGASVVAPAPAAPAPVTSRVAA